MKYMLLIFASLLVVLQIPCAVNADQQVIMKIEGMTCKL